MDNGNEEANELSNINTEQGPGSNQENVVPFYIDNGHEDEIDLGEVSNGNDSDIHNHLLVNINLEQSPGSDQPQENQAERNITLEEGTADKDSGLFDLLKKEFNLKSLYTDRDLHEMGTTAVRNLFLGALTSCTDVYTDFHLFYDYHFGAMYTKTVDTINHQYVNSTDCTLNYKYVESWTGEDWMEESVSFQFNCFELDPVFAWFTLAFIFLPGLPMLAYIVSRLRSYSKIVAFCCFPIIIMSYPFVLIVCKVVSIFHNGKRFKRLCVWLSVYEGTLEATPQLCLQVFIICSRGDRSPSALQWFTLVTSVISLNLPQIELFNITKRPAVGSKDEILRILKLLPFFLSLTIFRILSFALVCVLLRYYAGFYYGAICLGFCILACFAATNRLANGFMASVFTMRNTETTQFHMIFWFTLNTITLVCFLILCNSSDVKLYSMESSSVYSWSSLPIVADIIIINTIIGLTLGCGFFSLALFLLFLQYDYDYD